ncbi:MAG: biotin--[acetyl-CoA-carboxylase] ligase [Hyphomicrobiales bacterium]|nr:biotin--[acetyl-CoA-carboxylase] ligase [Hyphomicrobiales bacterium]
MIAIDGRRGSGPAAIHRLGSIDSTNAEAVRRARDGMALPAWIIADEQTAGRGRSGRSWASVMGNLYASYVVPLTAPAQATAQLSLVAGVAVIDAIRDAAAPAAVPDLRLKWPNDVLLGDAKLSGILIEATSIGTDRIAVIGIGVNVTGAPSGLGRAATHLNAFAPHVTRDLLLDRLVASLAIWLETWRDGAGFARVRDAWLERGLTVGEPLSVNTGAGQRHGTFAGLADSGALRLATSDGRIIDIDFGDVAIGAPTLIGAAS